jgi:predicted DNA binding CopG/RHH family protein
MGFVIMKKKAKAKKKQTYRYDPKEWDDDKSVEVTPEPRLKSGVSTSIRLPKEMVTKLKKIARRKGDIGYQTLLKIWIAERLEKESA